MIKSLLKERGFKKIGVDAPSTYESDSKVVSEMSGREEIYGE